MESQETNQTSAAGDEAQAPASPATAPQPPAAVAAPLPNVPEAEWPGAAGAYKYSKQAVKRNWAVILCLLLVAFFVPAILRPAFGVAGSLVGQLVSLWIEAALVFAYFAGVRGQKITFSSAFAKVKLMLLVKFIVNSFLVGLIVVGSALAFIVPFFFVMPRLIFSPYLVLDKDLDPVEAISASWAMTKGYTGKVWGIIGINIAMGLLFITIIGIPFALYLLFMYAAAFFVLYEFISRKKGAEPVETTPAAPSTEAPVAAGAADNQAPDTAASEQSTPATETVPQTSGETPNPAAAEEKTDQQNPPAPTPSNNLVQ